MGQILEKLNCTVDDAYDDKSDFFFVDPWSTPRCACCNGDILGASEQTLCTGGCNIVNDLLTKGITFNAETNKWNVQGIPNSSFFYSDQALQSAALRQSSMARRKRGPKYVYSSLVHPECCTEKIKLGERQIKGCILCAAWYNWKGGRPPPIGKERTHCEMRKRLEDEKNGSVYKTAQCCSIEEKSTKLEGKMDNSHNSVV